MAEVHNLLFKFDFSKQVREQTQLITPVCDLILISQKLKYSLGQFVKHWLELPSKYKDFEKNKDLQEIYKIRSEFVLSNFAIMAYVLLPNTEFDTLDKKLQYEADW